MLSLCGCVRLPPEDKALPDPPLSRIEAAASWSAAADVLQSRCVVCHGCYDAPCQLKLDTYSGIARGGSPRKVFDGARLLAAEPTRLDIDAQDIAGWRQRSFHAVLPESARSDPRASLLVRVLDLKRMHPLPNNQDLARDFTLELDRKQTCADRDHFDEFARAHPLWGMPYGLPSLSDRERTALTNWVVDGAPYAEPAALSPAIEQSIDTWESFLNQPALKSQLMARYLYEHLFLASLYFRDVDKSSATASAVTVPRGAADALFFRLVRSRTPPGARIDEIATRRPFDDPDSHHLYYRLVRRLGPPLSKTHMVYALDAQRLDLFRALFLTPDYEVKRLPGYEPEVAANPFRAFIDIPVKSRYRFLLSEAEFTIMGFIKGPVCRGQIALNVIQDRFWITFLDPDAPRMAKEAAFLAAERPELDMPAEHGSSSLSILWHSYARAHDSYMKKRIALLQSESTASGHGVDLSSIWDGDGTNANAALTVFRHFDNATVVQGLVGGPPQTAWVIDYPLLERIHYLLIAGFDVFGNVGHQLETRVYMDFLRMEGEANFLLLLPPARRAELVANWYRGATGGGLERVKSELLGETGLPNIEYKTRKPELELFEMLRSRVRPVLATRYELPPVETALTRLAAVRGVAASWLPEASFLSLRDGAETTHFSILRESAHTNVAHLFGESARRIKEEDALTVTPGFATAYPNALFAIERNQLDAFVDAIARLDGEPAYRALRMRYGVLRNSPQFWPHSDQINAANHALGPIDSGLFDYNRLEPL